MSKEEQAASLLWQSIFIYMYSFPHQVDLKKLPEQVLPKVIKLLNVFLLTFFPLLESPVFAAEALLCRRDVHNNCKQPH